MADFDLRGAFPKSLYRPLVIVRAAGQSKGLLLVLDTGDSREIVLRKTLRSRAGLTAGTHAVCVYSTSAGAELPDELSETSLVECKSGTELAMVMADQAVVSGDKAQNVISIGFLRQQKIMAVLGPRRGGRKVLLDEETMENLSEMGVESLITDDVGFKLWHKAPPTNAGMTTWNVPIVEWNGNQPFVETSHGRLLWDTGATLSVGPRGLHLYGAGAREVDDVVIIKKLTMRTLSGEPLAFTNVPIAIDPSVHEITLGSQLFGKFDIVCIPTYVSDTECYSLTVLKEVEGGEKKGAGSTE